MSKRAATSELNHKNWNVEDEPEDSGTFQKATSDVIQNRVIKSAKRRSTITSNSPDAPKNTFANFTGFKTNTSASPSSSFNFLKQFKDTSSTSSVNGSASTSGSSLLKEESSKTSETVIEKSDKSEKSNSTKSTDYYSKLRGLNESVSQWIKLHVDANPLCILTPIFQDYERYLAEIENPDKGNGTIFSKSGNKSESEQTKLPMFSFTSHSSLPNNKHGLLPEWNKTQISGSTSNSPLAQKKGNGISGTEKESSNKSDDTSKNVSNSTTESKSKMLGFLFNSNDAGKKEEMNKYFGKPKDVLGKGDSTIKQKEIERNTSTEESTAPAKKEKKETNPLMVNPFVPQTGSIIPPQFFSIPSKTSSGFSLDNGKTFSSSNKADDDDYQPPKAIFTPVQEEGATFSKRCKVYVRKDSSYQDHGIGTLYLKPVPSEDKMQLIVRAETSIGNLIINCLLNSSMSPQKMGENNVMLMCVPTPESKLQPVPVLFKVKTSADAEELLGKIKEHIKEK